MKKRNVLAMLVICALVLTALTACGGDSQSQPHTHAATGSWYRNGTEHWQVCECGEELNWEAHQLDEMGNCAVCSSEIWDFGDGSFDVYTHDEHDEWVLYTSYAADGSVLSEQSRELEYDADGNLVHEKCYEGDRLTDDNQYVLDADGSSVIAKAQFYQEDGSSTINEYDLYGNITYASSLAADGTVETEHISEYAQKEDGEYYESRLETYDYVNGEKYIVTYDQYESPIIREKYMLDDGTLIYAERYEREYNDQGQVMWVKEYQDGRLVREIPNYVEGGDNEGNSWRYPATVIHYHEDGGKQVTEYVDMEPMKETLYNADGTVEHVITYEYVLEASGDYWDRILTYMDGRLAVEERYSISQDGWNYMSEMVEYHEDGTSTVYEYDENEELLHQTTYTADAKYEITQDEYENILTRDKYTLDGTLVFSERNEYGYDDEGQIQWAKEYLDGRLVQEITGYNEGTDETGDSWRYPASVIEYNEDGTKLVTEYEGMNPVTETLYNADGSVANVTTY